MLYTRCAALCCAARHQALKNAPKKHYSGDKTGSGKSTAALPKLEATAAACACNRTPARPTGTLEEDSFRPERRRLRREGAWCFAGCLSPILPPTAQATRRGRRVCALNVPTRLLRRPRFLGARVCSAPSSRHIRAAVVAARSSYPRATLCADALVYRLQLQTPCVAKSSSAGDSSLANKGSPRATPRADPL